MIIFVVWSRRRSSSFRTSSRPVWLWSRTDILTFIYMFLTRNAIFLNKWPLHPSWHENRAETRSRCYTKIQQCFVIHSPPMIWSKTVLFQVSGTLTYQFMPDSVDTPARDKKVCRMGERKASQPGLAGCQGSLRWWIPVTCKAKLRVHQHPVCVDILTSLHSLLHGRVMKHC